MPKRPHRGRQFFKRGRHAVYNLALLIERFAELRANNLAMFEAIRYLAREGLKLCTSAGTERENQGLRRFKLSWGARRKKEISYARFEMAERFWKHSRGSRSNTSPTHISRLTRLA